MPGSERQECIRNQQGEITMKPATQANAYGVTNPNPTYGQLVEVPPPDVPNDPDAFCAKDWIMR